MICKNCGNCRNGKKHGRTMVYCTFFGIDISASYDRCRHHKGALIVEVEHAQDDNEPAAKGVRQRQVS